MKPDGHGAKLRLWYVLAVVSSAILFYLYPHQVGTLLWKLNVLSLSLLAGFWADRALFPNERPGRGEWGWLRDAVYQLRRVVLMSAIVLAVANIA